MFENEGYFEKTTYAVVKYARFTPSARPRPETGVIRLQSTQKSYQIKTKTPPPKPRHLERKSHVRKRIKLYLPGEHRSITEHESPSEGFKSRTRTRTSREKEGERRRARAERERR